MVAICLGSVSVEKKEMTLGPDGSTGVTELNEVDAVGEATPVQPERTNPPITIRMARQPARLNTILMKPDDQGEHPDGRTICLSDLWE